MRERATAALVGVVLSVGCAASSAAVLPSADPYARDAQVLRELVQQRTRQAELPLSVPALPVPPEAWRDLIDQTWGEGLPTEKKLAIFDALWRTIDEQYPSFGANPVDWKALRNRYRPEVAAGVSRGRFAAIMDLLAMPLRDGHVHPTDIPLAFGTPLSPGIPLALVGEWGANNSGACGTVQPDGSTLLYRVVPNHPLGLQAGDQILGFDGKPWKDNLADLLAAELPLSVLWWGSTPSSYDDAFMSVANLNWHLFATMDVRKFDSGLVVHLPTAALAAVPPEVIYDCAEQLPIPGIPFPWDEPNTDVSWGVLPGTNTGYITTWGWHDPFGVQFTKAVEDLTQKRQTDGLIVDHRLDLGGYLRADDDGLDMLFAGQPLSYGLDVRSDPLDHFLMQLGYGLEYGRIGAKDHSEDPRHYDKPIAILEGPGTVSMGDHSVLRLSMHPRARTFGRPPTASFAPVKYLDTDPDWRLGYTYADVWLAGHPGVYLTHRERPPDEPVWFTPADAAAGRDTVLEAAKRWIQNGG